MTITPIGASAASRLPDALGHSPVAAARDSARPAAQAEDQVTLSAESRAATDVPPAESKAEAPALRLSPAELRALVAPDSPMSPLRKVDRNAVMTSAEAQAAGPGARTRLFAGDPAVR